MNIYEVIFMTELYLKTFEVMFVRMFDIVKYFIFIRKLYLLQCYI